MRSFKRTLLAGAVALAVSAPAAAQFSEWIFFGDSLHRCRLVQAGVPPGTGLFTTNPGPDLGARPFGQTFGFTVTPGQPGRHRLRAGRRARNRSRRLSADASDRTRRADRDADARSFSPRAPPIRTRIYAIDGGANDIFTQLTALQAGTITQAQAQANVALAAAQLARRSRGSTPPARNTSSSGTCPTSASRRTGSAKARPAQHS